ncbi:isoaspartyl peptidase/L-asparaginase family protein [Hyunsoonleella pacifica]|uniref:Isoaspartyl peptidase n=1 Tax=Hyunsoonleella pacifica TaxID=1080224 RepID=A0A4Q9FLD3_9FLAO|nr:isoaspartyl peptidase/L-asparaginase [Hyunsoonleella pacifica]TBN14675.1 isoaspartyl peptidase/L-asparaginase [Hyunsoonleella pacifica]GGD15745.1 isoaspartyl peptidase/L-asparaginase [Hyunsoonleella pacifica]
MKKITAIIVIVITLYSCKNEVKSNQEPIVNTSNKAAFSIVIHGGAGYIRKDNISKEKEEEYRLKLEEAIRVGYNILKDGGSSIDAVQKTINILEDSPLFNSGKGGVFTNEGTCEHDASIMDGNTLNAGASAGTKIVKNPINLARVIMENSPHVMLAREGAETFAKEEGLDIVAPSYFYTEKSMKALERVKAFENKKVASFYDTDIQNSKFGTVGCAALDKHGNLAAGTSTGGMTNKRWGRIGDSPIIGAGTYANNNTCAVSSTGWGEYFIRGMVAYDISALMEYKGLNLEDAAKEVIQNKLPSVGDGKGNGGIIAVDYNGNMVMEFNTPGMFRATMDDKGELYVGMFAN